MKGENKFAVSLNFTFHYRDDVLPLNNFKFDDFVACVYPIEFAIKEIRDTVKTVSFFDLNLETRVWLKTKRYDKRKDFFSLLLTFHFYVATSLQRLHTELYIYQSILIFWAYISYHNWERVATQNEAINQHYKVVRLKSSFRILYRCSHELVDRYWN